MTSNINNDKIMRSWISCLSLMAQHHGINASVDRILHKYAVDAGSFNKMQFMRIAQELGFKNKIIKIKWESLARIAGGYPVIALKKDGQAIILSGFLPKSDTQKKNAQNVIEENDETVAFLDPMKQKLEFEFLSREESPKY